MACGYSSLDDADMPQVACGGINGLLMMA